MLILYPLIMGLIVYWMVGLNDSNGGNVIFFLFISILMSLCGNSLGLLGGSAFTEPKVAMDVLPAMMLPL